MHILVITDEIYPDGVGGVGKSLYNECIGLVRRGNQVTVLVRALDPSLPPDSLIEGLKIVRIQGPARTKWYYRLYPILIVWYVIRWLQQYDQVADVIYIHGAFYFIPIWYLNLADKAVVICSFYAALDEYIVVLAKQGKYGALKWVALCAARVLGWVEKWAFYNSDAVLPRSIYSLKELDRVYPRAFVPHSDNLIPLSIDTDLYQPLLSIEARTQLKLPLDRPILITVRRLDGRMGLTNLVEAMQIICVANPNALLLIAGKGYLRPTLEALIEETGLKDNVRLLGFVSESDLPVYLAASDIFVLPTESLEGFGLATVEALSVGIPVIGTPIGATPEILHPIEPALLTEDITPAALAKTIMYWLNRKDELKSLGIRCRQYAEQNYSSRVVAERLQVLFTELATRKTN